MPPRVGRGNALPPPHILGRGPVEAHVEVAQHGRVRDVQLAHGQVDPEAGAGPPAERHEPVLQVLPLARAGQPARRPEVERVLEDGLGLVHVQDPHAHRGAPGDVPPADDGALGRHHAREGHARRDEAERLLDGRGQQRELLEVREARPLRLDAAGQGRPDGEELRPQVAQQLGLLEQVPVAHDQRVGDGVGPGEDEGEALVVQLGEVGDDLGAPGAGVEHAVEDGLVLGVLELLGRVQDRLKLAVDDVADLVHAGRDRVGVGQQLHHQGGWEGVGELADPAEVLEQGEGRQGGIHAEDQRVPELWRVEGADVVAEGEGHDGVEGEGAEGVEEVDGLLRSIHLGDGQGELRGLVARLVGRGEIL